MYFGKVSIPMGVFSPQMKLKIRYKTFGTLSQSVLSITVSLLSKKLQLFPQMDPMPPSCIENGESICALIRVIITTHSLVNRIITIILINLVLVNDVLLLPYTRKLLRDFNCKRVGILPGCPHLYRDHAFSDCPGFSAPKQFACQSHPPVNHTAYTG